MDPAPFRIATTEYGDPAAPTVVLIHGVIHRQHAWAPVLPLLSERFHVVTLDLPSHGDSDPIPPGADKIPFLVDAVEDALRRTAEDGPGRPHIVGNSLGGWVALELGNRGLACGVTALSPAGFFRGRFDAKHAEQVFTLLHKASTALPALLPRLSANPVGRSLMFGVFGTRPWRYSAEYMAIDADALSGNELIDEIPELDFPFTSPIDRNLPITVAWGTRDLVLLPGQRHRVHDVFPQARIIPLKGLGHVPMSDDPEKVAEVIRTSAERSFARELRLASLGLADSGPVGGVLSR